MGVDLVALYARARDVPRAVLQARLRDDPEVAARRRAVTDAFGDRCWPHPADDLREPPREHLGTAAPYVSCSTPVRYRFLGLGHDDVRWRQTHALLAYLRAVGQALGAPHLNLVPDMMLWDFADPLREIETLAREQPERVLLDPTDLARRAPSLAGPGFGFIVRESLAPALRGPRATVEDAAWTLVDPDASDVEREHAAVRLVAVLTEWRDDSLDDSLDHASLRRRAVGTLRRWFARAPRAVQARFIAVAEAHGTRPMLDRVIPSHTLTVDVPLVFVPFADDEEPPNAHELRGFARELGWNGIPADLRAAAEPGERALVLLPSLHAMSWVLDVRARLRGGPGLGIRFVAEVCVPPTPSMSTQLSAALDEAWRWCTLPKLAWEQLEPDFAAATVRERRWQPGDA